VRVKLWRVLAMGIVLAACGPPDTIKTARDDAFVITATVSRLAWRSDEAIDVRAALTYVGPESHVNVHGIDYGLVTIWFEQLDGPLRMNPISQLMCAREVTTLIRGTTVLYPPIKAAAYRPDEPSASFYISWGTDPAVHLPPGRWEIKAHLETCGGTGPGAADHELTTPPLTLQVSS
jgi:hypothetical protein